MNVQAGGQVTAGNNIASYSPSVLTIVGTVTMTAATLSVTVGNGASMGSITSGGFLFLQGTSNFALNGVNASSYSVASGGTLDIAPSRLP